MFLILKNNIIERKIKAMSTVKQALLGRKSVRAFLDKKVSKEDIIDILNHARYSPSGTNTQPWEVAVVTGNSKKKIDNILLQAFLDGNKKIMDYNYYPTHQVNEQFEHRKYECGKKLYGALNISINDREQRRVQWAKNYSAFNAPVVLFFFLNKELEKGSFIDYGLFLQSIALCAYSKGLATCLQASLAEQPQIVKDQLNYGDDYILICGMALGYEDKENPINNYRTDRSEVVEFTRFYE